MFSFAFERFLSLFTFEIISAFDVFQSRSKLIRLEKRYFEDYAWIFFYRASFISLENLWWMKICRDKLRGFDENDRLLILRQKKLYKLLLNGNGWFISDLKCPFSK